MSKTTMEQWNKKIINSETEVAFVNGEKIPAEGLQKWAQRRLEFFPELLAACEHGAMSSHHPACSHGKEGDGNTCECHVGKCKAAFEKATN